jgi:hypothetical protein
MAKKVYRTAQGKHLDFQAMITQGEMVPAVGNMNVNARGDEIDSSGNIIRSRDEIMQEYHKVNSMVPTDEPVHANVEEARADEEESEDWANFEPVDRKE